ncbi:MAG TPA: DUF3467 domain-containing protein [Planctomycetaceae bacterium]|nr:DUF3467 domain-containing protein [Planctomycetaceae bacterium]
MTDGNGNPPEQRQQTGQPLIEPEGLEPLYANFCRVSSTPEELVLDFGLNPQPFGGSTLPVKVTQRLVVNFYTAKRMAMALGVALQRHEQAFGPIEIDVNKRAVNQPPKK